LPLPGAAATVTGAENNVATAALIISVFTTCGTTVAAAKYPSIYF